MKNLRALAELLKKTKFGGLRSLVSLLGLLLVTNFIYGQKYETIVDTTKMWVVFYNFSFDPPSIGRTGAIKINDSVMLEDNKYWQCVLEAWDSTYNDWALRGYIREYDDVVVYQDKDESRIDTIYNYNWHIGDTVFSRPNDGCFITLTDTMTTEFAGKNRFVQEIQGHHYMQLKYYEGIGSNAGLLDPYFYCRVGVYRYLVCYYKNDELLYQNPDFSNCYINNLPNSISNQAVSNYEIYPNPFNDDLVLNKKDQESDLVTTFELYNNMGVLLKKIKLQHPTVHINVSAYTSGIYYYRLYSKNQNLQKGILIKK